MQKGIIKTYRIEKINFYIIIFLLISFPKIQAQVPDSLDKNRLIILSSISAGAFIGSQIIQKDIYWSKTSKFHIMDLKTEYDDALLADKAGHFFASYTIAKIYTKLLEWTGLEKEKRIWIGSGVSLFHQTYVEINDGFSDNEVFLGFSNFDMLANISGASIPILQYYYPNLNAFTFKISYNKSDNFDKIGYDYLINDYESTYHWLSIDMFKLFDVETKYLDIVGLSIGHSVNNIDRHGAGNHEIYIGLDINWNHFYKYDFIKNYYYLQLLIEVLDKYKFPLPAIRINPNLKLYGFR